MLHTINSQHQGTIFADLFGFVPDEKPASKADPPALKAVRSPGKATPPTPKNHSSDIDDEPDGADALPSLDEDPSDSPETFIAKRMFKVFMDDLSGRTDAVPDMFDHVAGNREQRKQDALIWMFNLNPDGADMPFEWVCNEIGIDHELVRRVTARNTRAELKRIVKLLAGMVSVEHAKKCEIDLLDYVNLSGWQQQ